MSSIILQTTSNKNNLPDDIFDHNHDKFYEIIGRTYGVDLANLISFQSIRNGEHLLEASSDDILLILGQESEDLNALKKMCCFQVVGNKYEVKLGVKLVLNKLIQALKTKQEEQQNKNVVLLNVYLLYSSVLMPKHLPTKLKLKYRHQHHH